MFRVNANKMRGFSLLELMVVIAIIGILVSAATAKIDSMRARAKQSESKTMLNHIHTLSETYKMYNGGYLSVGSQALTNDLDVGTCNTDNYCNSTNSIGFAVRNCTRRSYDYQYQFVAGNPRLVAIERRVLAGRCATQRTIFTTCAFSDTWQMDVNKIVTHVGNYSNCQ